MLLFSHFFGLRNWKFVVIKPEIGKPVVLNILYKLFHVLVSKFKCFGTKWSSFNYNIISLWLASQIWYCIVYFLKLDRVIIFTDFLIFFVFWIYPYILYMYIYDICLYYDKGCITCHFKTYAPFLVWEIENLLSLSQK